MPAWRRRLVTLSANFAGAVMAMLGFRTRISGYENYAKAKQLGAVSGSPPCSYVHKAPPTTRHASKPSLPSIAARRTMHARGAAESCMSHADIAHRAAWPAIHLGDWQRKLPDGNSCPAQIGLFNHTSWVDAIAIMWLFAPSGVSKASNADIPLIGTCIRGYQNIYVSRASIENAKGRGAANGGESVSQKIAKRCPVFAVA
jgi:hypothetical protein